GDAKKWPENLGVGKPYQENIDERLEDWMTYICYNKMKKQQLASQSLNRVTDFKPQIENTVRNFLPANELITAWAMEKLASKAEATEWLQQEVKKYPENQIIEWCLQVFKNGQSDMPVADNAEVRLVKELEKIK